MRYHDTVFGALRRYSGGAPPKSASPVVERRFEAMASAMASD